MKKIFLITFTILAVCSALAQNQRQSYLFATVNTSGFVDVMGSTFSKQWGRCSASLTSGLEYFFFMNESVALRLRGEVGYGFTARKFRSAVVNGGLGLVVSPRDGMPYGFAEMRPRWDNGDGSTFFVSAVIGVGYNYPLTEKIWLTAELGYSQNFTAHTSDAARRDESDCFLTIGVRYLIKCCGGNN